ASTATATGSTAPDDGLGNTRNRHAPKVHELGAISVSAALDQARNALSPDTGSSQYVIDQKAIAQLPLGASTPVNQVILPESISGFGQTLDARTIQSVSLLDGALPAQYGLRTAAVVDITTKSGHD